MKEPVSEEWLCNEALKIAACLLDQHMERDASVVHQLVRRLRQQSAELAKIKARLSDLHDVPPEHD